MAVDVPIGQSDAFDAFVDERRYSGWLGGPVRIRNGRFRATLEWGTEVRGTYEVVSPPDLIAMRWDFDDDAVPLPGRTPLVAYLRVHARGRGSRVEVHQLAHDERQADVPHRRVVDGPRALRRRPRGRCAGSTRAPAQATSGVAPRPTTATAADSGLSGRPARLRACPAPSASPSRLASQRGSRGV